MDLSGKTIVITGASQGLGEALAYKVSGLGAKTILIARTEKLLETITNKITKSGGKADYFVCDIRDPRAVQQIVKKILKTHKKVDILVNNAGVWTDNDIEKSNPERRKTALETNALGHIQFTHELLPHFQNNNQGYVFNVISTSGVDDIPAGDNSLWQTYGASKWAMAGFTKALKDSLKDTRIKITGFFPGGFDSNLYENAKRENPHKQPWMMKVDDVADIIVFALTRPNDVVMDKIVVTKMM